MKIPRIVLDTNILVSGLRSNRGQAFRLLSLVGSGRFETVLSIPLMFEYEDVLARSELGIASSQAQDVINYLCQLSKHQKIFFLWRPHLKDPKDDHVLELAVASQSDYIVTYNLKDFSNITQFGIKALKPIDFLDDLEAQS